MQAPSHVWIAPTTITANYPLANIQQFLSLYQAKMQGGWINEWVSECMKAHEGNA
jgi:hypothetical protein